MENRATPSRQCPPRWTIARGCIPRSPSKTFVVPTKYLAAARLVRAARLLESPGYSITQVAFLLEYSSPQSFSRHVHGLLDIGAAEFRQRFDGERMLEHMRQTLVLPYRPALLDFDPFHSPPSWMPVGRPSAAMENETVSYSGAG
jgi:hypothetical protein